MLIGLGTLWTT